MTQVRRSRARLLARPLLALLVGMLTGGGLNAALGEKGADTPAFALLGGALALAVVIVQTRRRARDTKHAGAADDPVT